jgi:hypothetical protein
MRLGSDDGTGSGAGIGSNAGTARNDPALRSSTKNTQDVLKIDIFNIFLIFLFF